MWYIHAAEMSSSIAAVHYLTIWEDVCKSTFVTKLAVSLYAVSAKVCSVALDEYLCEVFAGRTFGDWLVRVQEGTSFASLTCALPVELAGDV